MLFLVLVAGIVLWLLLNGGSFVSDLQDKWEAQRLQREWEKPYRQDKYGGKTPEETYDMFLKALREGDTVLASKYFVIDEQEKWEKTLALYEDQEVMSAFAKELEEVKKIWKRSENSTDRVISFTYLNIVKSDKTVEFGGQKIMIPAGNYTNETEFELNTYTNIWKISSL